MHIYTSFQEVIQSNKPLTPLVVTVGFFDGVHLGHRKLIEELSAIASERKGKPLVITFYEHPLKVLYPDSPSPVILCSYANKLRYLAYAGATEVLVLPFTPQLAQKDARGFLSPLLDCALLGGIVLGYDNTFGRRSSGMTLSEYDASLLSWAGGIHRIDPVTVEGEVVSSSAIRHYISSCNFPAAEKLLGRPYSFLGIVESGYQIGRTIDYPTANIRPLDPSIYLPMVGIYVAEVRIKDCVYPAMAYYGRRPTLREDLPPGLEVYLLDFSGDLYGQEVEVGFKAFLRGDKRFDSLGALARQLAKDERLTREYFSLHPLSLPTDPDNVLKEVPSAVQ